MLDWFLLNILPWQHIVVVRTGKIDIVTCYGVAGIKLDLDSDWIPDLFTMEITTSTGYDY
jgi:hypothetical protein